jgi:aminopeptidase N
MDVTLTGAETAVPEATGLDAPLFVLPVSGGLGYGEFDLDPATVAFLTAPDGPALRTGGAGALSDVDRGAALVALWEAMLEGDVAPDRLRDLLLARLPDEPVELNVQTMLGQLRSLFWRFTTPADRASIAGRVEAVLASGLADARTASLKSAWFNALEGVATTPATLERLERVWRHDETIPGLPLSEADEAELAMELAVRDVPNASAILSAELERIKNPDRRARFAFVMPALSRDPDVRAGFFNGLADITNRAHEAWVLEGLSYLNHPLRADASMRFITPALLLVREIQRTGDIFFPKRWADASLRGYQSPEAAAMVRAFLNGLPADYPPRLRWVIETSADPLFRASGK